MASQHARSSYSAALEKHSEQDVLHRQLLTGPKVRDVVRCSDCNKPSCVYAATKLMPVQQRIVTRRKEDNTYTCGNTLFASYNQYVDPLVVRESLKCDISLEVAYYAGKVCHFPDVCVYFGSEDHTSTDDDIQSLKHKFSIDLCCL